MDTQHDETEAIRALLNASNAAARQSRRVEGATRREGSKAPQERPAAASRRPALPIPRTRRARVLRALQRLATAPGLWFAIALALSIGTAHAGDTFDPRLAQLKYQVAVIECENAPRTADLAQNAPPCKRRDAYASALEAHGYVWHQGSIWVGPEDRAAWARAVHDAAHGYTTVVMELGKAAVPLEVIVALFKDNGKALLATNVRLYSQARTQVADLVSFGPHLITMSLPPEGD